jgi:DNA repair exonuclease SbcCD ATPase subunit
MKRTKEEQKLWRIEHREDILKQKKKYREKNKDKIKKYYSEYRNKNKNILNEKGRIKHLLKKYGLTPEKYNIMFESQNGKCPICNKDLDLPQVDHSHKTGKIRGLLCFSCNILLGHSNDNINILTNAINYLKNSN